MCLEPRLQVPALTSCPPLLSLCPLQTALLTEADKSHFQDGLIQFSTVFAGFGDVWLPVGTMLSVALKREGLLGRAVLSRWGLGGDSAWEDATAVRSLLWTPRAPAPADPASQEDAL